MLSDFPQHFNILDSLQFDDVTLAMRFAWRTNFCFCFRSSTRWSLVLGDKGFRPLFL